MSDKIKRIYVDTSVIGAIADEESRRQQTTPFWDAVNSGKIRIIVSDIFEQEIKNAPQNVRDFFTTLPESFIERFVSTEETDRLAALYIAEKVVGQSSLDDCKHIAIATVARADVLISWNFKHIVNVDRIRGYNSVNEKHWYPRIEIRTPEEVIHDEN